jgi:hypothetical protein
VQELIVRLLVIPMKAKCTAGVLEKLDSLVTVVLSRSAAGLYKFLAWEDDMPPKPLTFLAVMHFVAQRSLQAAPIVGAMAQRAKWVLVSSYLEAQRQSASPFLTS